MELGRALAAQAAAAAMRQGRVRHLCDCDTQWWDNDPRASCPSCGVECGQAKRDMFENVRLSAYEPTPPGFGGFERLGL